MELVQSTLIDNNQGNIAARIAEEDQARSATYAVLSSLLDNIPSRDVLDYLCHIENPVDANHPGDMGAAWLELRHAAQQADPEHLDDEYHALFIGLGRGEIIPYGSWHMTGFLMDKPLSELRDDLRALGFEADESRSEPEDHIAAVCETMSILIQSDNDDLEGFHQRRFFLRHLHPWGERFFRELQTAPSARFYRAVGLLGERYMQLESHYLNIQQH